MRADGSQVAIRGAMRRQGKVITLTTTTQYRPPREGNCARKAPIAGPFIGTP